MSEFIKAVRVLGFWRTTFYRTLYRQLQRWMHRHHLHYAPLTGPDGNLAWCQWCGLRYTLPYLQNFQPIKRASGEPGAGQ